MKSDFTKQMTVLSIAQPWASCIIDHGKNVENRSANLHKRGTVALYASTSKNLLRFEMCKKQYGITLNWENVPRGAIIGFMDIVDVIDDDTVTKKTKKWFMGDYGYVLVNIIKLKKPVPAKPPKGAVTFWKIKGKVLQECLKQIPANRLNKFQKWATPGIE